MTSPYFESAGRVIDESKAALLKAVAENGAAGKAAYEQAQQGLNQARQDAVNRAASRSHLGIGGDNQTFLGNYDARANQMAVNRAGFESGLAQTQASGESYLEKARGAIPVLQAVNTNKALDTESKIKTAIAAAQAKAQAELEKEQRAEQRRLETEARAEARAIARENRAAERAAKKEAAKDSKLTKAELLGAGQTLSDQYAGFLGKQPGGPGTFSADESARALAAYKGISPLEVNTLLGPRKAPAPAPLPQPLSREWIKANTTYTDKRAGEILAAPEVGQAAQFLGTLATTKVNDRGLIDDASARGENIDFNGMTPRQAFETWLNSVPGIKSMKESLRQYYGPWIDANLRAN